MHLRKATEKRSTELRLLTATIYFKALNKESENFRPVATPDFDPQSPVVPATTTTDVSELCAVAREHFDNGASSVMIPLISPSNFTLSVLTLNNNDVDALAADKAQTVTSLFELYTPKRSWDLEDLYGGDREVLDRISRSFDRLSAV